MSFTCIYYNIYIYISFIGVKSQDKRVFMGLPSVLVCWHHVSCISSPICPICDHIVFCFEFQNIMFPACLLSVSYRCPSTTSRELHRLQNHPPRSRAHGRPILAAPRKSKSKSQVFFCASKNVKKQGSLFPSMVPRSAKHRIPPSPKGSRLSLNVTGCVSHWLEWQSKVYLSHLVT